MKNLFSFLIPLLLVAGCQERPVKQAQAENKPATPPPRQYVIRIDRRLEAPRLVDTFTVWQQFFRLWNLPDTVNQEELKDRLTLIDNALTRMNREKFPPKLDTVDVKSRLLYVTNETKQLRWVLDNDWDYPRTDSLLKRWTTSYENLLGTINALAADTIDFEKVFREKFRRDQWIDKQFGQ